MRPLQLDDQSFANRSKEIGGHRAEIQANSCTSVFSATLRSIDTRAELSRLDENFLTTHDMIVLVTATACNLVYTIFETL